MIDRFLNRRYSQSKYNCAHFAIEVWKELTGENLDERLHGFLCAPSKRRVDFAKLRSIELLDRPRSPCLVLMQRSGFAHVGVWLNGKVLHLLEVGGVQYMPLEIASLGFNRIRFFLCK